MSVKFEVKNKLNVESSGTQTLTTGSKTFTCYSTVLSAYYTGNIQVNDYVQVMNYFNKTIYMQGKVTAIVPNFSLTVDIFFVSTSGSDNSWIFETIPTSGIQPDSIFSYSYSEDASPLEPTSIDGGTSQLTISGIAIPTQSVNNAIKPSRNMINDISILTDTSRGSITGTVKKVSVNAGGIATVVSDTVQSKLNVEKTALAFSGTIYNALTYYCSLCNVVPDLSVSLSLDWTPAHVGGMIYNFIGWKGNVWEHLKMMCAALSTTDPLASASQMQMYVIDDILYFRDINEASTYINDINYIENFSDINYDYEVFDATRNIKLYNYNTSYITNGIVHDLDNYYPETIDGHIKGDLDLTKATTASLGSVDAGKTITQLINVDASLLSINQPVCVNKITSIPYTGTTGEYVIVGSDDLAIQPAQWIAQGGSIVVALTDNPGEVKITITAPDVDGLLKVDSPNGELGYAPYKIGIETSAEADYPAFWVTGTGIAYNKVEETYVTAVAETDVTKDSDSTIDNPFIINKFIASRAGVAAAQKASGTNITLNGSISGDYTFGSLIGKNISAERNRFRIKSANYDFNATSISAEPFITFNDFNAKYSGTFSTLSFVNTDFNEFSLEPLRGQ